MGRVSSPESLPYCYGLKNTISAPQHVNLPHNFIDPEMGSSLDIVGCERLVDWMRARMDDGTPLQDWQPGVKVVFISEQSKIGRQFIRGFDGIGALLLRPMSFQEPEDETTIAPDSDEDFA